MNLVQCKSSIVNENKEIKRNNAKNINKNTINNSIQAQKQKQPRHITFVEKAKYIYFDWDLPVLSPRRCDLTLLPLNESIKNDQSHCLSEILFIKNYEPNFSKFIRLEGSILVRNFTFEKRVSVRYTLTNWKTFTDIEAFYIASRDADWDRFAYFIKIDASLLDKVSDIVNVSFAIKYTYNNTVYWDNNSGYNYDYKLQYLQ